MSRPQTPPWLQSPHSPYKTTLCSNSQLKRLSIKRTCPRYIEFNLEEAKELRASPYKDLMIFLSKRVSRMKNPPLKETLKFPRIAKHLRRLELKPEEASRYITRVSRKFSNLTHFAIVDEYDTFSPMRLGRKVYPMRNLRNFVYDHEFCKNFMRCARYVENLKIRKISLDFAQLKRLKRLRNFYIILKTKYLSLPEEDQVYVQKLSDILLKLPLLEKVTLDQDIDPECYPFVFMDLIIALKDKVKVDLVADFIDVSNQKNKHANIEKIAQMLSESGIRNLYINYVGVVKILKRFGRSFYAPIHVKKELYIRFLKAISENEFKQTEIRPAVHSSFIDKDLRDSFFELMKPTSKVKLPRLTLEYHLDVIEPNSLDLLLDLYNHTIPSYEIVLTSHNNIAKGLPEQLETHYSAVLAKVQRFKAEFSLQISVKNLAAFTTLLQIVAPKVEISLLKTLKVQIIEPITKANFKYISKMLTKSYLCNGIQELELDLAQKEVPNSDDLFDFLSLFAEATSKLRTINLIYHNSFGSHGIVKETIEQLRVHYRRLAFTYEVNRERADFD